MKKSIYELSNKEGRKILKDFKKTAYYKQYLFEVVCVTIILALISGIILGWFSGCDCKDNYVIDMMVALGFVIAIGFISLISVIFAFKRLDLIKDYYDNKNRKDK